MFFTLLFNSLTTLDSCSVNQSTKNKKLQSVNDKCVNTQLKLTKLGWETDTD